MNRAIMCRPEGLPAADLDVICRHGDGWQPEDAADQRNEDEEPPLVSALALFGGAVLILAVAFCAIWQATAEGMAMPAICEGLMDDDLFAITPEQQAELEAAEAEYRNSNL